MKNTTKYIKQGKYHSCSLIALLNARIYYDKPYPVVIGSLKWEKMIDKYGCRYGSCLDLKQAADDLDLDMIPVDIDDIPNKLPVSISSFTKIGFHCSLVTNIDKEKWTIINYDSRKGPLCQIINKQDIEFPPKGNINNKHYQIKYRKNMTKKFRIIIWISMIILWILLCIILFVFKLYGIS